MYVCGHMHTYACRFFDMGTFFLLPSWNNHVFSAYALMLLKVGTDHVNDTFEDPSHSFQLPVLSSPLSVQNDCSLL